MVLCVGAQVVNVDGGQARDEQLQLLLVEDGDEALWNDVVEALQEGVESGRNTDRVRVRETLHTSYELNGLI